MQKVIIKNGKTEYIDLTPEEKTDVLQRVANGEAKDKEEKEKTAKKKAALDKLKANKDYEDLLIVLGLDS